MICPESVRKLGFLTGKSLLTTVNGETMAHRTLKPVHHQLADRLNRFPQGAPPSALLLKILQTLFTEREAELVASLPIRPFDISKARKAWKTDLPTTRKMLDQLCDKMLLVDMEVNGNTLYVVPPPMAGFFEFSMMRVRDDIDQKALSELFYAYLNIEDEFVRQLFADSETQLGRVLVHEPAVDFNDALHVLDFERSTEIIKTASHIGIALCYCRHKMLHVDRVCDAPLEICMTFNGAAQSLIKHGFVREVGAPECLDLLQVAYEQNLVQFGENVREGVNFICNCCGCCCEAMIAAKKFAVFNPIHTTNFMPEVCWQECTGCGSCATACPVEAISLDGLGGSIECETKFAKVDELLCLGCGVCVRTCPSDAIALQTRQERVITPLNSVHRVVLMAIERGKLQNLIFDNHVMWSHRALAALLGAILKLPPVKQVLASKQVNSRYLERLSRHFAC